MPLIEAVGTAIWVRVTRRRALAEAGFWSDNTRVRVGRVWSFQLAFARERASVVSRFGSKLAAPGWLRWEIRFARYAAFLRLGSVRPVPEFWIDKRDRRAWVTLTQPLDRAFAARSHG